MPIDPLAERAFGTRADDYERALDPDVGRRVDRRRGLVENEEIGVRDVSPRERNELIALVKKLVVERGISVLFTEHSMDVVFAFADRIIVLARGRLIADGTAAQIRDDAKVQEVYFGAGKTFAGAPS